MLEGIDRITVMNAKTSEELAVITPDEITTSSDDVVVILRPVYD